MNKDVLKTSLVWLAILTLTVGILLYRYGPLGRRFVHRSANAALLSGELQPEVAGPPVNPGTHTSMVPQPALADQGPVPALAPIQLTPERMQSIGVQTGEVRFKQLDNDIRATANVDIDERLVSYVQLRFAGYLRKVFANATYQYVRAGEPLFTVYSPDLVATQQEFLLARQNERVLGTSTVDGVASGAEAIAAAAEQRLLQWQVPESELTQLKNTGKPITNLTINSPVSGYITERNAFPDLYVEPSTRLYTLADLSHVWVYAQVSQDEVGRLKPGDTAVITVDSYPGRTFNAHIEAILPQVDLATRTVRVRLALANPGLKLKPGMFVDVQLKDMLGRALVVPASAVIQSGTRQIVFLDEGGGNLRPREVTLGTRVGDDFVILHGLAEHQKVVTSASFLIDSESQLQAAAADFNPPPSAAASPATAIDSAVSSQAKIAWSTDPSPAQRGDNNFRVSLTRANGSAFTGAEVVASFYMAGMPAMGMAAMQMTITLAEKGSGTYEGSGKLASGGTWQVTVTARKGGQVVASKQLRLTATGGM